MPKGHQVPFEVLTYQICFLLFSSPYLPSQDLSPQVINCHFKC